LLHPEYKKTKQGHFLFEYAYQYEATRFADFNAPVPARKKDEELLYGIYAEGADSGYGRINAYKPCVEWCIKLLRAYEESGSET
jgi:hypothetical protein